MDNKEKKIIDIVIEKDGPISTKLTNTPANAPIVICNERCNAAALPATLPISCNALTVVLGSIIPIKKLFIRISKAQLITDIWSNQAIRHKPNETKKLE